MSRERYLTAKSFPQREKGFCRVCGGPVPRGRRTICGQDCSDRLNILCSVQVQVSRARKRDNDICQLCGWDMRKTGRIAAWAALYAHPDRRQKIKQRTYSIYPRWPSGFRTSTITQLAESIGYWTPEVDHIIPVCRGGGVHIDMSVADVLENLRTLCPDCHKKESAALAADRAIEARTAKMELFK